MTTATLEEAQAKLPALIANLKPGEDIVITQDNHPVARLVAEPAREQEPRRPGSAAGILKILEEDDAHLEDFKEYMQ